MTGEEVPGGRVRGRGAQLTPPPLPGGADRGGAAGGAAPRTLCGPLAAPKPQHGAQSLGTLGTEL